MRAFGIGCLWFTPKHSDQYKEPSDIDAHAHLNAVQRAIESIPNLTSIDVFRPSPLETIWGGFQPLNNDDNTFDPRMPGVQIRFNVYLPQRIQDQILSGRASRAGTENFNVEVVYGVSAPTAYISYDTEEIPDRPSDGVVVVRKYLEKQFENTAFDVAFRMLGPSPFHANFLLREQPESEERQRGGAFEFVDLTPRGAGYGYFLIEYRADHFDSLDVAMVAMIAEIQETVEQYYMSVRMRNAINRKSTVAQALLEDLLEVQTKTGVLALLRRLRATSGIVRDLNIAVLGAETERLNAASFLEHCRRTRLLEEDSPFTQYIERELSDKTPDLPLSQVREIVKMFEDRHLKALENGTVAVSGLMGGIIGALITAAFRS